MYRLFGIGVVLLWLSAMGALFARDVWPAWTAQSPPPMDSNHFSDANLRQQQYGIFRGGERTGTAWGNISSAGSTSMMQGTILLQHVPLVPELLIESITEFESGGTLDSFRLDVLGIPQTTICVRGEQRGAYFPCTLQVGPLVRQASLDLSSSRLIGDSMRPFSFLPNLHVGQSWRMQLLDPLSAALSRRAEFKSIVARVTGQETITSPLTNKPVECYVVETVPRQVKAWVEPGGRVLVQEVDMPGMGKVTVREEPYDGPARAAAKARIRRGSSEAGDDE